MSHKAGPPQPSFNKKQGTSLAVRWLRLRFHWRGGCSIPGGDSKIPPASPTKKFKKRKRAHRGRSDVSAEGADPRAPHLPLTQPEPAPAPQTPRSGDPRPPDLRRPQTPRNPWSPPSPSDPPTLTPQAPKVPPDPWPRSARPWTRLGSTDARGRLSRRSPFRGGDRTSAPPSRRSSPAARALRPGPATPPPARRGRCVTPRPCVGSRERRN